LSPRHKAVLAAALLLVPGSARAAESVPLPQPRPPELTAPQLDEPVQPADAPRPADVPLPPERPAEAARAPAPTAPPPPEPDDTACREALTAMEVKVEPAAPLRDGACGAAAPLRLTGLPGGVKVDPPATVTCRVAQALAPWTRDSLLPEALKRERGPMRQLQIGTSYECRNRNRSANGPISEHAYANGVDVHGFRFENGALAVGAPEGDGDGYVQAVRQAACAVFATVIGPGTDAEHADHLHLDMRARRNNYRICQ
jgi:hypothetical protein